MRQFRTALIRVNFEAFSEGDHSARCPSKDRIGIIWFQILAEAAMLQASMFYPGGCFDPSTQISFLRRLARTRRRHRRH
jgi:hypothetical protein